MKNIKNMKRAISFISAAIACTMMATGCADTSTKSGSSSESSIAESIAESDNTSSAKTTILSDLSNDGDYDQLFSSRDLDPSYSDITAEIVLSGSTASVNGSGAKAEGTTITITQEGVYRVSGTLDDGQIIIDADKAKVQLILDNADINCSNFAAIYAVDSDKLFITLAEGSMNSLTDGETYENVDESGAPDACIYSSDSITINGTGSLTVNGNYGDGIHSKDDIVITGGSLDVSAVGDGIKGKDYVAVYDGDISITAGEDGIKSTNSTDEHAGFVYIKGGTFSIAAVNDAIQTETDLITAGGTFDLTAGGGSSNATKVHTDDFGGHGGGFGGGFKNGFGGDMPEGDFGDFQSGGRMGQLGQVNADTSSDLTLVRLTNTDDTVDVSTDNSTSTKGIKAGSNIDISGGDFTIDSADDAVHSNGDVNISGGTFSIKAGDDGIHADSEINISGGNVTIKESYEGIESAVINVTGGVVEVTSSDDGFNASDGTAQGGMGTYSSGAQLNISGGTVYVNADGDGLDSNGDMTISGGNIIVNGPTNSGNGALDGNNGITVTGGTLIASGASGMTEAPDKNSTQNSVSATFDSTISPGTLVTLTDDNGKEIISFTSVKTFNNVVISSADLSTGATYTFYTGGSSDGSADSYGVYSSGYKNDGTEAGSFTVTDVVSYVGQKSMMGGGRGGMGRNGGGFQMPTDENGNVMTPDNMPEGGFGGMTPPDGEFGGHGRVKENMQQTQ